MKKKEGKRANITLTAPIYPPSDANRTLNASKNAQQTLFFDIKKEIFSAVIRSSP
jgi:hypothetical protein